ncbi:hypothetical protein Vi05172_g5368 [Venturia inaequalis]|nr:hypothetical protein Vi05172_g5368 [Venturia inaequalis]
MAVVNEDDSQISNQPLALLSSRYQTGIFEVTPYSRNAGVTAIGEEGK